MSSQDTHASLTSVAIIGMAGRFPGAKNLEQYWQNLRDGVESIASFSDEELLASGIDPDVLRDPRYVKARGFLQDADHFDAAFFGYSPREAEITDPQHRLFLECAWEALEDAGYDPESYTGTIGAYAGMNIGSYMMSNLLSNPDLFAVMGHHAIVLNNIGEYLPTRLSYKLNLRGPSINVQTACSTSLVAVFLAYQSLLNYQTDLALAGGSAVTSPPKSGYFYQEGGILSPDGHCRAFDADAQGTVSGDGIGVVVLKRLEEALADGDHIHAVIRGAALNNDGAMKVGFAAPSVEGQAEVIALALSMAEVEPEAISYIETHGTATPVGDPIEISALTRVFQEGTDKKGFCAIGAVKSNIGHLESAAGVAGLIKTVLALKHRQIPPSLHYRRPNPRIDFENSPFYVNTSLSEWQAEGPRLAGVSAFGIGGTNAHVILEEAPPRAATPSLRDWHVLTVSAKTSTALESATTNLADYLSQHPDADLADVAYTLHVGRRAFSHRRAVVCSSSEDALHVLSGQTPGRLLSSGQISRVPSVAFLFPGQGAQHVQMARKLYDTEPVFREVVDTCSVHLQAEIGLDLRALLYPDGDETEAAATRLEQTQLTQPALFVIEYALAKLWMSWGVEPQALLGHSIGEYVAATLAGVFSLEDALSLVAERGRLMQALPGGAMLAVPMSEAKLRPHLSPHLSLAAVNLPDLCVVSGPAEAIEILQQELGRQGVVCRRLHTSHAFHSQMMEPILEPFTARMQQIKLNPPQIPFISNVTGDWITDEQATDPAYWSLHLRTTVQFADGIGKLLQEPGQLLLEVGPGQTLTTLARRHPDFGPASQVLPSMRPPRESQDDVALILTTLSKLWLSGVRINWQGFYSQEQRNRISLPTYPFERQSYWIKPGSPAVSAVGKQMLLTKRPEIDTWFYRPTWKQQIPAALETPGSGIDRPQNWLLFDDGCGLGYELQARLREAGHTVTAVTAGDGFSPLGPDRYTLRAGVRQHYTDLLGELKNAGKMPAAIVHLWSVTDLQTAAGLDRLDTSQERGFYSVLYLAQALGEHMDQTPLQITVVTNGVQDVTGDETLQPEKATVLGPCRVIPAEYGSIRCRSIDIVWPGTAASPIVRQLFDELTSPAPETVIAYRGRYRWVQSFEPFPARSPEPRSPEQRQPLKLRPNGVYLITGGLGGIGLALAHYLAETVQARLVLTSRSALPERSEWGRWLASQDELDPIGIRIRHVQELETRAAEVLVLKADTANLAEMRAAVEQTNRRFGPINGVIHAAGIAGGGMIQLKTPAAAAAVLEPKVRGTLVLDEVLSDVPLDFLVLCSSTTALLSGFGQVDYTGANAFLDAYAHRRYAGGDTACLSINWDAWQEVGMAVNTAMPDYLRRERMEQLRHGITVQEGQQVFSRAITTGIPQVVISTRDFFDLRDQFSGQGGDSPLPEAEQPLSAQPAARWGDGSSTHARPELSNPFVSPRTELESQIAEVWQELLGIQQVGVEDSFFDLGGDSLLAIRMVARMRDSLGAELPVQDLFDAPTVAGLAEILETTFVAAQASLGTRADLDGEREEVEL